MAEDAGQVLAAEALLKDAALLYERHEAGRGTPFNVFTVLRSGSDEVNLHSRFLVALLKHRKALGEPRENLKDFLGTVAGYWERETDDAGHEVLKTIVEESDFKSDSIRIERESNYIDILIANDAEPKWAVAIENKIWAGDQPQQLWKYYDSLAGYDNRAMLYLTSDGHEPEEDSVYKPDEDREDREDRDRVPEDRLCLISYKSTLPSWLERCQERAYAEPGLRESIEQYLNLVRELTGMDRTEEYMKELKELCMHGDNPRLIYDLVEALKSRKVDLLCDLLKDVESAVKAAIPKLPPKGRLEKSSRDQVDNYVGRQRLVGVGLYWPLGKEYTGVYLGISIEDGVYVGIYCNKDVHPDQHDKFKKRFKGVPPGHSDKLWSWYKWLDPSLVIAVPENLKHDKLRLHAWENIEFLCDGKRRQEFAIGIAQELKSIWDKVHGNTPA